MRAAALIFLSLFVSAPAAAAIPEVLLFMRAAAPGEILLIAVEGKLQSQPRGRLGEQRLSFYKTKLGSYAALAAFDVEAATGAVRLDLHIEGAEGPYYWSSEVIVDTRTFPTKYLTVAQKFVTPVKTDEDRAEQESLRLQRLYMEEKPAPLFGGNFKSPIPGAPSARFGERRYFNGVPKAPHSGADLRAGKGEPVRAPAGGRVALIEDLFYSGKTVILDHGLSLYTIYAHLSSVDVAHGQHVKAGQRLGRVGATGRVTGPHLHWGAKLRGARIDPFSLTSLPLERYRP